MQLKYIALVLGIIGALIISGCTQDGPGAAKMIFECEQMSMGWLGDFMAKYYIMPEEAIQCDNEKGSFIVITLDSEFAGDVAGKMSDDIIEAGISGQSNYYEEICSSSGDFCAKNLVVFKGKINTVEKTGDTKVVIIVVKSEKPQDAAAFLDGVWQNRNPVLPGQEPTESAPESETEEIEI